MRYLEPDVVYFVNDKPCPKIIKKLLICRFNLKFELSNALLNDCNMPPYFI